MAGRFQVLSASGLLTRTIPSRHDLKQRSRCMCATRYIRRRCRTCPNRLDGRAPSEAPGFRSLDARTDSRLRVSAAAFYNLRLRASCRRAGGPARLRNIEPRHGRVVCSWPLLSAGSSLPLSSRNVIGGSFSRPSVVCLCLCRTFKAKHRLTHLE
jgi:hypothetical protein